MTTLQVFASFLLILVSVVDAKLMSFMIPCKRSDPKLAECVTKGSFILIPNFVHGDAKLGIPVLDPLTIDDITIHQGTAQVGMTLVMKKALMHGNEDNKIVGSRPDLVKRRIEWDLVNDKGYVFEGDYTASGKVLVLPITGQGKANIKFMKIKTVFAVEYDLVNRDGKEYIHLTNATAVSTVADAKFKIDNLFNGDKLLGDNMNQVLNDNSKEMAQELAPSIGKTLALLYMTILNERILPTVTYDEIFPE